MAIPTATKTIGLALALLFVAATALAQTGAASPAPRGNVGGSTGPTFPSTADAGTATGSPIPGLNPPFAASPADPSPPTVDPSAPNLAIQRGGAGSGPVR
jgi:hypothetical protein